MKLPRNMTIWRIHMIMKLKNFSKTKKHWSLYNRWNIIDKNGRI